MTRLDPAMEVYLRLLTERADEALLQEEAAQLFAKAELDRPDTLWRLMADRLRRRTEASKNRR